VLLGIRGVSEEWLSKASQGNWSDFEDSGRGFFSIPI
jgi:hypothetical protein